MPNLSQGNRALRAFGEILKPILGLSAMLFGGAALAWMLLTRSDPKKAPPLPTLDTPVGEMFMTVTVADIGIELTAPDGGRIAVFTSGRGGRPIPDAIPRVDCTDVGGTVAGDSTCTVSIQLKKPTFGEYVVRFGSARPRLEVMTIGWGGVGFNRNGGLSMKLASEPRHPQEFTLIVAPEGISQKSEPRAIAP